jgi:UDP-glucose:(heptosyl)LPS alpha-1,3-glucosyltransferase
MRIGLIIQHADASRGGAERYTIDIAHALSHRGHDVAILASSFENVPWETKQVKLEGRGVGKAMAYARFLKSIDLHLESNSYDILHAMLPIRWCDLYHPHAGLAAELVAEGHLKYPTSLGQSMAKLGNKLNRRRQKTAATEHQLLHRAQPPLVVCLSEYVKQSVRRFYPTLDEEDMVTLFNAVDLRRFDPTNDKGGKIRKQTRSELGVDDTKVLAVMIAQNFHRKGLREAISAMAKVPDTRLTLAVVGKDSAGPYRALAKKLAVSERVIFVGAVKDAYEYYRAADFFLLPSKHDPCSLATLEALAMGVPVVSTKFNGATEIMTNGIDGFVLADPYRVDLLVTAIKTMMDPRKRATMAEACVGQRSRLSFENHITELLKTYKVASVRRLRGAPGLTSES